MTAQQHDWSVAILTLEQDSYNAAGYQIHHVSVNHVTAVLLLSLSQVSAESKESSLLQVIMLLK